MFSWLKRVAAGSAVLTSVAALRKLLKDPAKADPALVLFQVEQAVQAVEACEGIKIPNELVDELVAANLAIIQRYWAGRKIGV